jgi:hypothetical protein
VDSTNGALCTQNWCSGVAANSEEKEALAVESAALRALSDKLFKNDPARFE